MHRSAHQPGALSGMRPQRHGIDTDTAAAESVLLQVVHVGLRHSARRDDLSVAHFSFFRKRRHTAHAVYDREAIRVSEQQLYSVLRFCAVRLPLLCGLV